MRKILIIEDSKLTAESLKMLIENKEYEIDIAYSGIEAIKDIISKKYDLIITDINLPDISGFELIQFVRKSEKNSKTPIFVVSIIKEENDIKKAKDYGAQMVFTKPIDEEEFKEKVKEILK